MSLASQNDHARVPKVMKSETLWALVGFTAVKILRARTQQTSAAFPPLATHRVPPRTKCYST